jgi:hypothetical protein
MRAEIEDEICKDGMVIEHWSVRDDLGAGAPAGVVRRVSSPRL